MVIHLRNDKVLDVPIGQQLTCQCCSTVFKWAGEDDWADGIDQDDVFAVMALGVCLLACPGLCAFNVEKMMRQKLNLVRTLQQISREPDLALN